jgi:hypothetical protein
MAQIQMLADDNGNIVRVSQNNPETGFIVLHSERFKIPTGRNVYKATRSCYISGKISDLNELRDYFHANGIDGKIVMREYVKSEVPQEFLIKNKETKAVEWDRMKPKRAGNEGPILTKNGETIYAFAIYDETGTMSDILVAHDNVDAVRSHREAQAKKAAALPANRKRANAKA